MSRSPTLNSVGSNVAYPSFCPKCPETVIHTSLPAISVRNCPCATSPSMLTCWSLMVGAPGPTLVSGERVPLAAAPKACVSAAPISSEFRCNSALDAEAPPAEDDKEEEEEEEDAAEALCEGVAS